MIKRALCVIMCCVIAAALSISIFAVDFPINNVEGVVNIPSFSLTVNGVATSYTTPNWSFPFGYLGVYYIARPTNGNYFGTVNVNFTLELSSTFTVYIPMYSSFATVTGSYNFDDLYPYRDSSSDISISSVGTINAYVGSANGNPLVVGQMSYRSVDLYNRPIQFVCFKDVPAGSYDISILYDNITTSDPIRSCIGCYVSVTSTIFDDFENGYIDFDDAIDSVYDELNSVLDSDISDSEKLIYIEVANNDIERLKDISDIKFNGTVTDFNTNADDIIDDFVSGDVDVHEALTDIQLEYFDALSQAVTPEQGTYLNTSFQLKVDKLHLLWQVDFQQQLDDVVTDEKLDENSEKLSALDQLYSDEKEVLDHFELAEFESQLEFSLWTDTLPSDYANYKAIFEYFLEDNKAFQISQFLIVPLSLVLVSVLLATTTVVVGGFNRYRDSFGTRPFSFRGGRK